MLSLQMIAIYPHLLATSSRFVKCLPPLHDIADIVQLCRGEEDRIIEYKRFLISYLEEIHGTRHTLGAHMVSIFCTFLNYLIIMRSFMFCLESTYRLNHSKVYRIHQTRGQFNSGIGIVLFFNGIDKIGIEVCYKKMKSTN